ncbi:1575_t:CDS:2 [Paraglomus occultum]|uniref:1575_t:CDS:1 n=1 Tax=Paraglomus occultum TaxID=144539 RepID=A0A9N8W6U8_9GLOM|nr:1575_t:CDS:2 [Paraglomus occultum]
MIQSMLNSCFNIQALTGGAPPRNTTNNHMQIHGAFNGESSLRPRKKKKPKHNNNTVRNIQSKYQSEYYKTHADESSNLPPDLYENSSCSSGGYESEVLSQAFEWLDEDADPPGVKVETPIKQELTNAAPGPSRDWGGALAHKPVRREEDELYNESLLKLYENGDSRGYMQTSVTQNDSNLSLNTDDEGQERFSQMTINRGQAGVKGKGTEYKRGRTMHPEIISEDELQSDEMESLRDYFQNVSANDPDYIRSLEDKEAAASTDSDYSDDDSSSVDGIDFEELQAMGSESRNQVVAENAIGFRAVSSAVFEGPENEWNCYGYNTLEEIYDDGNTVFHQSSVQTNGAHSGYNGFTSYNDMTLSGRGDFKARLERVNLRSANMPAMTNYENYIGAYKGGKRMKQLRRDLVLQQMFSTARRHAHVIAKHYRLETDFNHREYFCSLTIYKTQLTRMPNNMERIHKYLAFAKKDLKRIRPTAKVKNPELLNKVRPPAGSIVGASAPPISAKNIGHQMLSKLGWSEGQTLGRSGGIAEPIEARVKVGRKGLGANETRKI